MYVALGPKTSILLVDVYTLSFTFYLLTQCSHFSFCLRHLGQFYMTACVKLSVENDINVLDEYGRTCLHAAASGG